MFKVLNIFEAVRQSEGNLPVQIPGVAAQGLPLFSNGHLGVDMIRLEANQAFPLHTHPGHHLLLVVAGSGTVTVGGEIYKTQPGDLYMVEGASEHAVGAGPEGHYLLSFGAPHLPLEHPDRMKVSENATK